VLHAPQEISRMSGQPFRGPIRVGVVSLAAVVLGPRLATATGPVPLGESVSTVSYDTAKGVVSFSGHTDYSGSTPGDAVPLGKAANILTFNSVNTYGRRLLVPGAIGPDESLVSHAFFKFNNSEDFFPGVVHGGVVTMRIEDVQFPEPVMVIPETILLHVRWVPDQVDQLPQPYVHLTNHYTTTEDFRDFEEFHHAGVFSDFPVPNFVLGAITVDVHYDAPDQFDIELAFPYELMKSLEESGQTVPGNLPAPHGFLEPFHWHLEYLVAPAPVPLAIIESLPPDLSIDARQPFAPGGGPPLGLQVIELGFDGPASELGPQSFVIEQAGSQEPAPSITAVELLNENRVQITLSAPLIPGTRLRVGLQGSDTHVCLGYLPGDVNADGATSPLDILDLVDGLNGVTPLEAWQCDINRSAACEPQDILRLIDLLNGAGAFEAWNGAALPACP
jgi:hypothetical protein